MSYMMIFLKENNMIQTIEQLINALQQLIENKTLDPNKSFLNTIKIIYLKDLDGYYIDTTPLSVEQENKEGQSQ